jgi:hypothetical protein
MSTVLAAVGAVLFVSCAVLVLVGWRNPEDRFLTGMLQTRDRSAADPARTAAAGCWLILGFAVGSTGWLLSGGRSGPVAYVAALGLLACIAVAAWVRFGDAPQSLRPATLRRLD